MMKEQINKRLWITLLSIVSAVCYLLLADDGAVWFGIQAVLLAIPVIWFFVSFRRKSTVDSGADT